MRPAEETVVRQCAPTLAGIKTGSLFPCPMTPVSSCWRTSGG